MHFALEFAADTFTATYCPNGSSYTHNDDNTVTVTCKSLSKLWEEGDLSHKQELTEGINEALGLSGTVDEYTVEKLSEALNKPGDNVGLGFMLYTIRDDLRRELNLLSEDNSLKGAIEDWVDLHDLGDSEQEAEPVFPIQSVEQ